MELLDRLMNGSERSQRPCSFDRCRRIAKLRDRRLPLVGYYRHAVGCGGQLGWFTHSSDQPLKTTAHMCALQVNFVMISKPTVS
jgi:hypothetical protein